MRPAELIAVQELWELRPDENRKVFCGTFFVVAVREHFYFTSTCRELHRARQNMRSLGRWSKRQL
jgi:hypothetical protein